MDRARTCTRHLVAIAAMLLPATEIRAQDPIAITGVTVIDGRGSLPLRDQTVVILGEWIISSGPAATITVPAKARRIDGRGKYLIPGLWDMHVHTSVPAARHLLGLYVANGVTGVRDMAAEWDSVTLWRAEIAKGSLVGPRFVAAGPYLEGGPQPIPHLLARTPEEGIAGVDSLMKLGVDFVKVHGQLTPATYFAIARRAREKKFPFAGHVSRAVGAAAASDSGQRSIEHLLAIPAPCTPAESLALVPRFPVQGALGRCSSEDQAPLWAKLAGNRTWVTPTFVAMVEVASWPERAVPGDSLAHYLPDTLKRFVEGIFPMPDSIPPGADSVGRAMLAKRLAQVASMHRAGVRILAGTDAPLRNSPPGFGLHEELAMLVRGGMSPYQVLRVATYEPARYFDRLATMGTVETGKVADLVLLDANPAENIANARRIALVIANGRVIDAAARARLLTP